MRSPRPPLPALIGIAVLLLVALLHTAEIRERATASLGRGMPAREAELARGFVLGQDDRIDPQTVEDFRRAGLSHLLAVSGENVLLLALLAMPVLGALGIPLRERLVWVLALIAIYVPLTGAGPSIQRAGVMGAAGVLATLAGRRSSRLYALVLALVVTLAIDPRVASDVGWQLSFAAVAGIFVLAAPLRAAIAARIGSSGWRHALAEGAAVTIAATLATAPLIAFHFEAVSTTTLFANLLALPAVAPAMWLGMLAAAAAQVPGFPVEFFNALDAPLLAYIAQVAAWCGRPSWAYLHVRLSGTGLAVSYVAMVAAIVATMRLARAAAGSQPSDDNSPPTGRFVVPGTTNRPVAVSFGGRGGWDRRLRAGLDHGGRPLGARARCGLGCEGARRRAGRLDPPAAGGIAAGAGRRRPARRRPRREAARRRRRSPRRRGRHPRPVRPRRGNRGTAGADAGRPVASTR